MSGYATSEDSDDDQPVTPQLPPLKTLRDHITESCILSKLSDNDEKFLPNDAIERLVTRDTIVTELGSADSFKKLKDSQRDKFIKWIREAAPKLFLIHVQAGLPSDDITKSLRQFKKLEFTDRKLPIENLQSEDCKFKDHFLPCWSSYYLENFSTCQWKFVSPVFESTRTGYNLSVRAILPFIHKDIKEVKAGAFSNVYKVTIHEAHRDPTFSQVAIKEIQINHEPVEEGSKEMNTEKVWELEALALNMVSALNHDHMVKFIAAIRKGDKRYFMFPWASGGSLRDFWEKTPKQNPSKELIQQSIFQLRGLADALYSLHNYNPKPLSQMEEAESSVIRSIQLEGTDDTRVPGIQVEEVGGQPVIDQDDAGNQSIRHGDLKPENILRFLDNQLEDYDCSTSVGTLRIADMGLAKRHVVATQDRAQGTSTRFGTALYEAPEVDRSLGNKARSRLYDVWSMGCITFEFILWLLYGNAQVTELHNRLKMTHYHYFEVVAGTERSAQVHRVVLQWMQYLQEHDPDCKENSALGDLLKLVKTKLLVVDLSPRGHSGRSGQLFPGKPFQPPPSGEDKRSYRCTSEDLLEALDDILSKLDDDDYVLCGQPRDNVNPPSNEASPTSLRIPRARVGEPSPKLQVPRGPASSRDITRTAKADYTLPPLEDWEYPVDNDFAGKVVDQLGTAALRPLPRSPADLCQRCTNLNFWRGGFAIEDKISDLHGRSTHCSFCQMLWNAHRTFGLPKALKVRFERHQSTLKLSGSNYTLPVFSITRSPGLDTPLPIQIGFPQLLQPGNDLFFSLLRLWLQDCDEGHKGCRGPKPATFPTRLIDVGTTESPELRLVESRNVTLNEQQYIALSHPWGDRAKHPPFSTLRKRSEDTNFQGRDLEALKEAIPYDQLPATFKDAILTTKALKVRYLWIDSLCIIQGEDGDFNEESKRMEDVFSCAYCVLAASRATGQHDGFLKPTQPREYTAFQRGTESPFYVCENIDNFSGDVLEGSLNTRGWVLQERALARRTIFFTERQAYFECGRGVRCQTLTKMHNNMADFLGDPNFPNKAISVQRSLKIRYFQDLYRQYSRLNFTHIEDRPFAIEGLENRLRTAYGTDGAYGIFDDGPGKGLFHRSLLWQRGEDEPSPGLSRIVFPLGRRVTVPTWSWMAYQGGIDYVDPLFDQTEWEKDDIHPPRIKSNNTLQVQKTEPLLAHGRMELLATVRRFNVAGHQDGEVKLVYDSEKNLSDGMRPQCVVVAKSREGQTSQKKYYVLLVCPLTSAMGGSDKVYERVGAGFMLGRFIIFSEPGQLARIR